MSFKLFDFQTEAVNGLTQAALDWVDACATHGPIKIVREEVPFLGELKAVTGAGKTPILAKAVTGLGPAVVLWTTRSAAVADQTFRNLSGKYRTLLPRANLQIMRERPSKSEWRQLVTATRGLSIWITTVAAWNEAEAASTSGKKEARLNMHRPHQDWGGKRSPWDQLRSHVERPLWIVYDESHNQSPAQLDQLLELHPIGFFLASATPLHSAKFGEFREATDRDDIMRPIAQRGRVKLATRDVVEAELLKSSLEVLDYRSEPEAMIGDALKRCRRVARAASSERASVEPKAVYVVQRSNAKAGELPRPVAIWQVLRQRRVPADEIAIYTDTRVVPDDAEKVSSLSGLRPNHRHIIFNLALQEGWDDPNAYVCYFDDQTKSYTRIQQIIGRILRQPNARRYRKDDLNTAVILIRSTNEQFEDIIKHIKQELRLYAEDPDDPHSQSAVRVKSRNDQIKTIRVKPAQHRRRLRNLVLGDVDLSDVLDEVHATGDRPWSDTALRAPGARKTRVVSLKGDPDKKRYQEIRENARITNRSYFQARVLALSRPCRNLIDPDILAGPAFDQLSCPNSVAQTQLTKLARDVVDEYEARVDFEDNDLPGELHWRIPDQETAATVRIPFNRAAHSEYPKGAFNKPELEFAEGLDGMSVGVWCRNPATRDVGYAIPLPVKVGTSSNFFPDFLWWVGNVCYAIDPTGRHILEDKVRAKLLTLDAPKIVLATPGKIAKDWSRAEDKAGWTMVRPRKGRAPAPEHFQTVPELLAALRR